MSTNVSGHPAHLAYAPDRRRWRQISSYAGGSETTIYVGEALEKMTASASNIIRWRHLIPTPGANVQVTRRSDGTNEVLYVAKDHLGSTDALLNASGTVLARASFAAYGGRRGSAWSGAPTTAEMQAYADQTRRGFTEHEMLDNVGLIHMNGRVYDPGVGRFMSADPIADGLGEAGGFNRYAYVQNRPLSWADPTGHSGDKLNYDWTVTATRIGYSAGMITSYDAYLSRSSVQYRQYLDWKIGTGASAPLSDADNPEFGATAPPICENSEDDLPLVHIPFAVTPLVLAGVTRSQADRCVDNCKRTLAPAVNGIAVAAGIVAATRGHPLGLAAASVAGVGSGVATAIQLSPQSSSAALGILAGATALHSGIYSVGRGGTFAAGSIGSLGTDSLTRSFGAALGPSASVAVGEIVTGGLSGSGLGWRGMAHGAGRALIPGMQGAAVAAAVWTIGDGLTERACKRNCGD